MRTGFVLAGVACVAACAFFCGRTVGFGGAASTSRFAPAEFEGYSNECSFDKAVADAVGKAWAELSKRRDWPKADAMLRYTVTEIGGERGGIAGLNRLRVKISASP